ncbi:hypothetical protein DXG01_006374 [Tephrocybe rancida]|nr:hypothetical protein DXG01_006374 [Tephrocybe rancida]
MAPGQDIISTPNHNVTPIKALPQAKSTFQRTKLDIGSTEGNNNPVSSENAQLPKSNPQRTLVQLKRKLTDDIVSETESDLSSDESSDSSSDETSSDETSSDEETSSDKETNREEGSGSDFSEDGDEDGMSIDEEDTGSIGDEDSDSGSLEEGQGNEDDLWADCDQENAPMEETAQEVEDNTLMDDFNDSDLQAPQESQLCSDQAQVQSLEDNGTKVDKKTEDENLPVKGQGGNKHNKNQDQDILAHHRAHNRSQKAPTLSSLMEVDETQKEDLKLQHNLNDNHNSSLGTTDLKIHSRAPRNSLAERKKPRSQTLSFYTHRWQPCISLGKGYMACYVALECNFFTKEEGLLIAQRLLVQAMLALEKKGHKVDNDYKIDRDMCSMVYEEATTFRGTLKTLADTIVVNKYSKHIKTDQQFNNQQHLYEIVQQKVKKILKDGHFHLGKCDSKGRASNIAHPGIKALCLAFFYKNKRGLAHTFPDDFKTSIPKNALALIMTCIYNCLEGYEEGYYKLVSFEGKCYASLYNMMLDTIEDVEEDSYYGDKLDKNCRDWAHEGMKHLSTKDTGGAIFGNIRTVLD